MRIYKLASFCLICVLVLSLGSCRSKKRSSFELAYPKREFRGAWLSTAWQGRYKQMSPSEMKEYFVKSLDQLQEDGINAIIFQVRPQADAFYKSKYEPWSAHLTGAQGLAPEGGFDPLKFLIEECHKRNMELHAWLNPYRVTTSVNDKLANSHLYYKEPDRFVKYDSKIYFDPGLPKNREFICDVVKDIVLHYNVDAIHMDDYFYPYPIGGKDFPDNKSFKQYGSKFKDNKSDWRRENVNQLIKEIKETISQTKPWVRFGISPFGIYRNKKNDKNGSETNGLQNYDDLYADVKLWVKKGWIDYNMPQIYWEIGHKTADYTTLIKWWNDNNYKEHLYIGQDVTRTMDKVNSNGINQLDEKMLLSRSFENVHGNCFWPAYELLDNYKGIEDRLRQNQHRHYSLIPAYKHMSKKSPKKIKDLKESYLPDVHLLEWSSNHTENDPETAQYYVVYKFKKGQKVDLNNAINIVAITKKTYYELPYEGGETKYNYVVTSVDGFHNESKPRSLKLKL